jgi:hypothetical protein
MKGVDPEGSSAAAPVGPLRAVSAAGRRVAVGHTGDGDVTPVAQSAKRLWRL